jgi:hypothetical protein
LTTLTDVVRFFDQQRPGHHRVFPATPQGTLIGFLGTTGNGPGPTLGVNRIVEMQPGERSRGIELMVEGRLPRELALDENVAACVVDLSRYRGYQIKSDTGAARQFTIEPKGVLIHGRSVYTVHHSPNVLNVFESIDFADVSRDVSTVRSAVLAVGRRANISPRFIFHYQLDGRELRLFHGDGLVHKTYLNLRENPAVSYLVSDTESSKAYVLSGSSEEQPSSAPGAGQDLVRAGFAALGFELSKIFVTHVTRASAT